MKLLIVRHGQSHDDVIDAYGGWADFPLSEEGKKQIEVTAEKVASLNIKFDKFVASPLLRAQQTAEIINQKLNLKIETDLYFKERNTYGLLCGVVKSEAKEKYADLVEAYDKGEYVIGSERAEDANERVKKAFLRIKEIEDSGVENLIIVTHGVFMKHFFDVNLGKKLVKKVDGGFIMFELENGKLTEILHDGIEIE